MTKRRKTLRKRAKTDRFPLIEKALEKLTKADLVTLVVKLAQENAELSRALEAELDVQKPIDLLVSDIEWAFEMLLADRVGFICDDGLKRLAGQS